MKFKDVGKLGTYFTSAEASKKSKTQHPICGGSCWHQIKYPTLQTMLLCKLLCACVHFYRSTKTFHKCVCCACIMMLPSVYVQQHSAPFMTYAWAESLWLAPLLYHQCFGCSSTVPVLQMFVLYTIVPSVLLAVSAVNNCTSVSAVRALY